MKTRVLVASIVVALGLASCGSGKSANITGSIANVAPLNNQFVRVWVTFKNKGNAAGTASCFLYVTATNSFGDQVGTGSDGVSPNNPLNPGKSVTLYDDVTVSGNNAQLVTSVKDASISNCA